MSHQAFVVRDGPAILDPDVPGTHYYFVIFVQDLSGNEGWAHSVTGDLVLGMHYEKKRILDPRISDTFHDMVFIGNIDAATYHHCVDSELQQQPPPPKQKAFNRDTMKTEPCKKNGTFYGNEERPRLIKCTEWTLEQAVPALKAAGVLTN